MPYVLAEEFHFSVRADAARSLQATGRHDGERCYGEGTLRRLIRCS